MSFAGEGTPDMGLSAMFWNPAAVTQTKGWGAEAHVSFSFPNATVSTNPNLTTPTIELLNACGPAAFAPPFCDQTGNTLANQTFPAFYGAYRFNPDWDLGLSITRPFGFSSTIPFTGNAVGGVPQSYVTQQIGNSLSFDTIDVNPVVGWRLNDKLSVGIGPQFVWLRNGFTKDLFQFPASFAGFSNAAALTAYQTDGFGMGLTAGLTYTPTPATEIALGYRSQVRLGLSGQVSIPSSISLLVSPITAPFSGIVANVTSNMTLPDQVNIGVRQRVTDKLVLLGTVEWTHWSVLQAIPYTFTNGPAPGTNAATLFFTYRDSWFVSGGAEYQVLPNTTLRAGLGFETTPVNGTLGAVGPLLPGANTTSLSAGLSHKFTDQWTLDLAYSHSWIDTQQIVVGAGNPSQVNFITLIPGVFNSWGGSVASHNDVVSVALRYAFSELPPPPLLTKAK